MSPSPTPTEDEASAAAASGTLADAQRALIAKVDEDIQHITTMIDTVFDEFNFSLMKPEEEQINRSAKLPDLSRLKDFTPWFGQEVMDAETQYTHIVNGYRYDAETRRGATLLIAQLLVGLVNAPVQTYVEEVEIRFYPRYAHRIEPTLEGEEPGTEIWPAFEVDITLATILHVSPPSLLTSVDEEDQEGEDTAQEGADDALFDALAASGNEGQMTREREAWLQEMENREQRENGQ